jgi:hypothetical protein
LLDRGTGGGERLLIEMSGDIVALLGRVLVAFFRRKREPLVGFGEIVLDPDAAGIEDAEIVLAVGDAAIGAFAKPLGSGTVVC